MTIWVLDTDHLSLLRRGNLAIQQKFTGTDPQSIFITIVTVEEQLKGRLAVINRMSGLGQIDQLMQAYEKLRDTLTNLQTLNILEVSPTARDRYRTLLQAGIRIGSHDLRIAAMALSVDGVVVTRNHRDFAPLPTQEAGPHEC